VICSILSCFFPDERSGGSLTAWGVTKTKNRFKAAVVGAGAVDWEGMVLQSASPELEVGYASRVLNLCRSELWRRWPLVGIILGVQRESQVPFMKLLP
jgi:hypothetical protein